MLGNLPVPGRPTNLDYSRARACALAVGAGGGCLDIFSLICPFSPLSPSLWETARYRLKYCLKGPLNQNNQPSTITVSRCFDHLNIRWKSFTYNVMRSPGSSVG